MGQNNNKKMVLPPNGLGECKKKDIFAVLLLGMFQQMHDQHNTDKIKELKIKYYE